MNRSHEPCKWSIGILIAAVQGPVRYTELERTLNGISRRMLTLNPRKPERDGVLVRTVYPTVPPRWSTASHPSPGNSTPRRQDWWAGPSATGPPSPSPAPEAPQPA